MLLLKRLISCKISKPARALRIVLFLRGVLLEMSSFSGRERKMFFFVLSGRSLPFSPYLL